MKKRNITLLTAFAAAAAFASTAQADLVNADVLRSTDGGSTFTQAGQGADADFVDWGLGTFTTTGAGYVASGTPYFKSRAGFNQGWLASDVLAGGVGDFLAGAQYLATDDADKYQNTLGSYQFTFDQAGTFYILEDNRGGSIDTTGYTDTGVDITGAYGLAYSVWSQTVAANQVLITPSKSGSIEPLGFAFQPAGGTTPAADPEITSITSLGGGNFELTLKGDPSTSYEFYSSATLDFTSGGDLVPLTVTLGTGGPLDVTTDGSGDATVQMSLGDLAIVPANFVRAVKVL